MDETNPTELRANLFRLLEQVSAGLKLRVVTKTGNVLIVPEGESRASSVKSGKLRGKIIGDLDRADRELRSYISIPK